MIHHVAQVIPASSLESCVDFYELLGFKRVPEPPAIAGRTVWLERSGSQIHLLLETGAEASRGHVAVVADDYEATVEALRVAGYAVAPRAEHWGSPRAFVDDPAGHTVELMAWPPGGSAGGPGAGPVDP